MDLFSGAPLGLMLFGVALLLCMVPVSLRARHDTRTIRGVGVWAKPLKFMAALALFAVTTAAAMLAAGAAPAASLWGIAALVMATSTFEAAYITWQAWRGQDSHYNSGDALHAGLLAIMAAGAVGLVASQAWLAWLIVRYQPVWMASVVLVSVVTGLTMTFVLGTASGFLLGANRAPAGHGAPVVGWHRRGDLRPAHFLGVHAQQCIPALGLLAHAVMGRAAHAGFAVLACAYLLAWIALTHQALRPSAPAALLT